MQKDGWAFPAHFFRETNTSKSSIKQNKIVQLLTNTNDLFFLPVAGGFEAKYSQET